MHEMSLCEGILQVLKTEAETQGFTIVKNVWLEIGELSSVEPDSMLFSFDVIMKNSLAETATLHIIRTAGAAWCMPCGKTVAVKQRFDECPDCGSHQLQVTSGDEMKIKELEVE